VRLISDDHVDEIGGTDRVEIVRTRGGHAAAADLVIVGVGVKLNTELAAQAGLTIHEDGGVAADEWLQTLDDPDIYVAGDIAAYNDVVAGRRRHIEHYMNAKWTGQQAGRNMAGANEPFKKVAYFFSDMFDLSMVLRGDPSAGRSVKILGDVDTGEFVELYADSSERVVMGIGFTREGDHYDAIVDGIENVILKKQRAKDVAAKDVGISG
jgi:3-phenylpropionate/trans-cinnamate dioxygenase ferredoxin reductase subunit